MVAITSPLQPALSNRRRRVRHKIQTPAYATFASDFKSGMLDLHEILNISEDGVAIQCHSPLEVNKRIELCLDLADCPAQIVTTGEVVWSNASGRTGLRFSALPHDSLSRLREWLFINVMAGVANSEVELLPRDTPRPSYTDTLAAVTVVQRQVEALGSDFAAALHLIAERAQSLVRASGIAIALTDATPDVMICRARSGSDAPPVGARLHVGSGFSGECVQTGRLLRCDDTEVDHRVDPESCRALGIRSILAVPVRAGAKSIGLIEVFSPEPNNFSESDQRVLMKFGETVRDAATRAARAQNLSIADTDPDYFGAPQGSVLFASADAEPKGKKEYPVEQKNASSTISLPRSYLLLLTLAAAAISMTLGVLSAPWIQLGAVPWMMQKIRARKNAQLQTVLASTKAPTSTPASGIETASFEQLRQMANKGDANAQNALGLHYATGDGVELNEQEAIRWFTKAAERGNVLAQSKLGSIYFSGRGVPQDPNRAYFWMAVARLNGDDASKTLAPFVQARLTRLQVAAIEQDASRWLQQNSAARKPSPTQAKAHLQQ
ncbi:MAG TPA: GAF domain-containing protein [Candidatus Sulfotelmatobacter sp.]|nr:GAF domain-containing protein [Candidatus Sulfotelmatobacter sp.]